MDAAVKNRWIALAAVVAGLAPALSGFAGIVSLTQWDPGLVALQVGAVLGGLGSVVVGWSAWRRSDRPTLGFALAALCFALGWIPFGALSFPISTILSIASDALLIAFGIVVLRRSSGATRFAGWAIVVATAVWLLGGLGLWLVIVPEATQTTLTVLFTISGVAQIVAFLAATALFVGPLLRPVRAGARYLWSTADVR